MPEITIPVDGKQVRLKATGGTNYRYKAQFGREFLADLIELQEFWELHNSQKKSSYDLTKFSLEVIYNIIWIMAKTADDSIPDVQGWLDRFDEFPVMDILPKAMGLIKQNLKIDAKNG